MPAMISLSSLFFACVVMWSHGLETSSCALQDCSPDAEEATFLQTRSQGEWLSARAGTKSNKTITMSATSSGGSAGTTMICPGIGCVQSCQELELPEEFRAKDSQRPPVGESFQCVRNECRCVLYQSQPRRVWFLPPPVPCRCDP
eukprot:TRINITY_DN51232_c0_g1_i1.p1 TRINITY_DN51232_c0_g1~~TRINITY_DN51232_c0_g1_i1.p1  ORF type:complete len:158 (-),score=15.07 TRINITY_DN51232_c0_g1_i1:198-632(-)